MWVKKIVPSDLAGCDHVFWWIEMMHLKVAKSFFRTYGLDFALVGILEGYEVLTWRPPYSILGDNVFSSVFKPRTRVMDYGFTFDIWNVRLFEILMVFFAFWRVHSVVIMRTSKSGNLPIPSIQKKSRIFQCKISVFFLRFWKLKIF